MQERRFKYNIINRAGKRSDLVNGEKKREVKENTCISESMKERRFQNNIINRAGKRLGFG